MAEKSFGVKEVNLIGASGTPSITGPNNLNLNAVNVAISTNVSIGGTLSVTGNVSVGGTLTYEDVTNIDSVGVITARSGIDVDDFISVGSNIHLGNAGVVTATSFAGDITGNVTGNISGGTVAGTTGTFTGNVTLGDSSSDTISMNGKINTDVLPSTNGSKDIGNSGNRFGEIHGVTFHGSGANLSNLPVADSDIQVAYTVTANGSSAYRFAGNGVVSTADNPDLYLIRGQKYRFINNSGGSHPFQIREASGGTAYSTGVTNNGASSGNIDFAPTYDSPAQLVYQCTSHGGMVGNIYLRDAAGNNTNVGVTTFSGAVNVTAAVTADDFRTDSSSSTFYLTSADDWRFRTTSGSEKIRIRSDGNVGINSTNPGTKLNVVGSIQAYDSATGFVTLTPTGSIELRRGAGGFIDFSTAASEDYDCRIKQTGNDLFFETGGSGSASEKLRITSAGQTKLNIPSNGNLTEPLVIRNGGTGSGTNVGMIFYNGNESSTGAGALARIKAIDAGAFDSDLTFETGLKSGFSNSTDERFRITSNGQLRSQGNNNGNAIGMELRNNNTAAYSHAELALTSQNATTSKVWCDVPNAGLRLQYNGGTAVKINQSGNLVMASGSGIDFSATGDGGTASSELFDDYEEGSYIPTVTFSGTTYTYGNSNDYVFRSPHSTSNSNSISYTKIGSRVFLNFAIFWNSAVTARYVISLPFTFRGSAYQLSMTPAFYQINISGDMLGTLGVGSAAFDTYRITNDTSSGGHANIPLNTSSEVYYMICYETTE